MFRVSIFQADSGFHFRAAGIQDYKITISEHRALGSVEGKCSVGSFSDFGDISEGKREGDSDGVGLGWVVDVEGLVESNIFSLKE